VCVAHSQGGMGYMLQQSLANVLRERGMAFSTSSIITRVEVAAGCDTTGHGIAVVGTDRLDGLRAFARVPLKDPDRVATWTAQIEKRGLRRVVADTAGRWGCREPIEIARSPAEAFTFEGLPQSVVFLRHPVTEGTERAAYGGTLFVVERETVRAPFDIHALPPFAFGLSGASYVLGGSSGSDSGFRLDQIFAVEDGRLRLVYQTSDLST